MTPVTRWSRPMPTIAQMVNGPSCSSIKIKTATIASAWNSPARTPTLPVLSKNLSSGACNITGHRRSVTSTRTCRRHATTCRSFTGEVRLIPMDPSCANRSPVRRRSSSPPLRLSCCAATFRVAPERRGLCCQSDASQGVYGEPRTQVLCRVVQRQQGFQRGLITPVTDALAAFLVYLDIGLGAGTMVVQIGVQELPIEAVDGLGVAGIDVAIAHGFADHRALLGLHQAIVVGTPGTAFGLLDPQFVEPFSDRAVDELAAVVGVEALDAEWERAQHGGQHRLQIQLADTRRRPSDLPLRDLIDGMDVIDAFGCGLVALMHPCPGAGSRAGLAGRAAVARPSQPL